MNYWKWAGLCAAVGISASAALAGPAVAADPPWEMPNVTGDVLQRAIDEVLAVAAPVELKIKTIDTKGTREQINLNYWTVCWQFPKAGEQISQKTKTVSLGVRRSSDPT